jgi:Cu(I)/Ag(I) efflux system membrane protein CusA/SilA
VTLAHVIFLMHFRSILIVTIPLPLAVLLSFLGMYYAGISSNIMSLAGIAIAIGVLVDAGIVVTENAFRYVEQRRVDPKDRRLIWQTVLESTRLVGRPVFFSMAIILLAFVPVFALTGQEGKLFHPLAFTKTFAVLAATVISVTLVPVLCTLLLGGKFHAEEANPVMRLLRRLYQPVLETALAHRGFTIAIAAMLFAGALAVARGIGSEFMPPLNEGDLMFMPIADPSISLEENTKIAAKQNAVLMSFPEVEYAVAKVARADTSTDPAPLNMTETVVHLKPRNQWRPGMTLDRLRADMGRAVQMPGVSNIWTMPIINRIDMLTTGVRSEVGVKVFGTELGVLEDAARRVSEVLRQVPGASNVYPEQVTSGQYLNIDIDRAAAARYGIAVGDIQQVIETAIGETTLTTTIEGRRRFPVRVRYASQYRADPQLLGEVLVASPHGSQVPLSELAHIKHTRGPAMISSENGLLLATVLLNVQGRDVGGFVDEARQRVAREVTLPAGYYIGWSGRWENQEHARQRLQVVVPIALLVIFVLLYFTYHSLAEAAHVLLAVPFALTGGVYLLWLLGYHFSVAVWVGFIALFGTAVQTGVVMVIYLEEAVARKRQQLGGTLTRTALREAVVEGALLRLRPKVMTVSTVIAGLLPIMWSTRVGAEVMKPLATPVLGGMVSSLLHVLVVTPVVFFWLHERRLGLQREAVPISTSPGLPWRLVIVTLLAVALLSVGVFVWRHASQNRSSGDTTQTGQVVQRLRSGNLEIVLLSPSGTLRQGRNTFSFEFRGVDGQLVDVGTVRASGNMPMPGMVMSSGLQVQRTATAGRYDATAEFGMAGAWHMALEWDGPIGHGSINFEGAVQ